MKKLIKFTVMAAFISVTLLGCNKTAKKDVKAAETNLLEAGKDVKEAVIADSDTVKAKTIADWGKFKTESDSTLAGLEKEVTAVKQKIANGNKSKKAKLSSELAKDEEKLAMQKEKLKQKNTEFDASLKTFDASVAEKSEAFKRKFKHDMDKIGTSLKDLFKDNGK